MNELGGVQAKTLVIDKDDLNGFLDARNRELVETINYVTGKIWEMCSFQTKKDYKEKGGLLPNERLIQALVFLEFDVKEIKHVSEVRYREVEKLTAQLDEMKKKVSELEGISWWRNTKKALSRFFGKGRK